MVKTGLVALLLDADVGGGQTPVCKTIVPGEPDALVASPANHSGPL